MQIVHAIRRRNDGQVEYRNARIMGVVQPHIIASMTFDAKRNLVGFTAHEAFTADMEEARAAFLS